MMGQGCIFWASSRPSESGWTVVDAFDVGGLHLFSRVKRARFALKNLWKRRERSVSTSKLLATPKPKQKKAPKTSSETIEASVVEAKKIEFYAFVSFAGNPSI